VRLLLLLGAFLVALRSLARRPLRAINPNSTGSTDFPPTATALVTKAKDLEALRSALVDAASVSAGLWFSYLFVMLYLLIAVGSVTHRDLLLESPVKLPFLGVDLPLTGFFWLGPALFLILHAYVLIHFVLLASKVGVFHTELQAQVADEDVRARLRRQLPSNIFVQFLAGPREVREGVMGFMLRSIAQISLVVGPVLLLVFFSFSSYLTMMQQSLGGTGSPLSSTLDFFGSYGRLSGAARQSGVCGATRDAGRWSG
jgi:hypothetical protein